MNLRWFAWLTVLVPLAAAHLAFLVSAAQGYVDACVPYWDGCTSISRAGRFGLGNTIFRSLMLPHAAQLVLFWALTWHWLRALRPDARRSTTAILLLGVVAALFLTLYACFLGVEGSIYQWLRRYGITVFFSFSVLAQMLVIALLQPVASLPPALRRTMLAFAATLLLLGLASIPLRHWASDADRAMDALEWNYALLMALFYGLIGIAWSQTGFIIGAQRRESVHRMRRRDDPGSVQVSHNQRSRTRCRGAHSECTPENRSRPEERHTPAGHAEGAARRAHGGDAAGRRVGVRGARLPRDLDG